MTETGRDVVERLRRELREARYLEPFDLDTQDALLDLVEAAQEAQALLSDALYPGPRESTVDSVAVLEHLDSTLAALHSQASDEGKA